MDTFIVALIIIAAVIALMRTLVKTFRSGTENPCGCGSACSGCHLEQDCGDISDDSDRIA